MQLKKLEQDEALELKSPGDLRLFFVGVGSAFSKTLNQTNLLIIKGEDHILVDCGTRTPPALHSLHRPVTEIGTYIITHSHADHIGGLEEVMLMARYMTRRKPRIIITPEYESLLWEESLKGGCSHNERHDGRELNFEDFWTVQHPQPVGNLGRDAWSAQVGGIKVTLFRSKHIPEQATSWRDSAFSTGIIIDDRVVFSADTRFDPELVDTLERTIAPEAWFHDCQFFTGGVHASLDELGTLPSAVKAKMHLTHFGDTWPAQKDKVASLGFAGLTEQGVYYLF